MAVSSQAAIAEYDDDTSKRWGIIVAVALAAVHLPFVLLQMKQSMARPHYEFAILIPIGFLALLIPRIKESVSLEPGSKSLSMLGFAFALLIQLVAVAFFSPFLGCIAAFVTILTVGYMLGSWRGVLLFLPCVIFLALMVPPPFDLDSRIIAALQRFTGKKGSLVLDYFGIFHLLDGNVIEVPGRRLFVEEACSGIHGLLSSLVCAVFYVAFVRRHWLPSILLVAASIFWVLVLNTVRVSAISICLTKLDLDLTEGIPHQILGVVIFVANLLLILSTDQLLLFFSLVSWVEEAESDAPVRRSSRKGINSLPVGLRIASIPLALVFGTVAVGQAAVGMPLFLRKSVTAAEILSKKTPLVEDPYAAVTANFLPATFDGWKQIKFDATHRESDHVMGEYSKIWYYAHSNGQQMIFSFDYTFPTEHDLTVCYAGTGWEIRRRRVEAELDGKSGVEGRPYCLAELSRPDATAYMCFSLMDRNGKMQRMTNINRDLTFGEMLKANFQNLAERLDDSLMTLKLKSGTPRRRMIDDLTADNLQLQLFSVSYVPISSDRQDQLRKAFFRLRQQFENQLKNTGSKTK